jgi:acyl transferase domain-containing protein
VHATPRTAALFPGQGCSLDGARELVLAHCEGLFALARELLDADPFEHASASTRYAQPAIFLASIASWQALRAQAVDADAFAGHSLGELSALTAAGVWSGEQGLRLVVLRAELMAAAGSGHDGGMLALLKGDLEVAGELAERFGVTLANDNSIGQSFCLAQPQPSATLRRSRASEACGRSRWM